MSTQEIYNFKQINDHTITGGQPTEAQLRAAADEGFATVINLATVDPRYSLPDEAGLVRELGMQYVHIPVEWGNPQKEDFAAFATAMDTAVYHKTLIHCAANYRVTAFYSLYAMKRLGWSAEQADDLMAHVWKPGEYRVWDEFVQNVRAEITKGG
ncbi:MAG TPA: protein tyrosine phosphatase family protein [Chloroflexota bacterium]|nr:protein tyrosine phosphatase family protein [Chloroflexota bacterium]